MNRHVCNFQVTALETKTRRRNLFLVISTGGRCAGVPAVTIQRRMAH